jgi:hypothetical protein
MAPPIHLHRILLRPQQVYVPCCRSISICSLIPVPQLLSIHQQPPRRPEHARGAAQAQRGDGLDPAVAVVHRAADDELPRHELEYAGESDVGGGTACGAGEPVRRQAAACECSSSGCRCLLTDFGMLLRSRSIRGRIGARPRWASMNYLIRSLENRFMRCTTWCLTPIP